MTSKVSLRRKFISKGRQSLYLDFYPPIPHPEKGELTRRKFLGLYLFIDKTTVKRHIADKEMLGKDVTALKQLYKSLSPLSSFDKQHNDETLKIANSIRQKYENQLNKPEIYSEYEKEQLRLKEIGERDFIEYFKALAEKKKNSNRNSWLSAINYFESFTGGQLKLADLNEPLINDYKEYLLSVRSKRSDKTTLSRNSAVSYFNKFKAALKQAYKDDLLQTDLNSLIKPIKGAETRREYLTIEELNKLVKTPCNDDILKRAALFSALTGLRFSDIQKTTWGEVEYIKGQGYFLNFTQQKTEGVEYYPISDQAVSLMGETGEPTGQVFQDLTYSAYSNKHLFQWIGAAGITKDITFHCFRHTFATQQLSNGTDIYTVSKMLGHKDLKTTQIYAKIVDQTKRKAANSIKLDM